jgi:uncharacterized membrane protein YeaQ/YmgE (transglycosylase-associated protein family)
MFALIGWCLFGLFAGLVSRMLTPGNARMGLFGTVILGILGSLVGGALSSLISQNQIDFNTLQPSGFIGAVIGGILVLMVPRILLSKTER